jgi:hypothetical protein
LFGCLRLLSHHCSDAIAYCAVSSEVAELCCASCADAAGTCVDSDEYMAGLAAEQGLLDIGSCADAVGYCSFSPEVAAICCASCADASESCEDSDTVLVDAYGAANISLSGCADVAGLCGDAFIGEVCCATCVSPQCVDSDAVVEAIFVGQGITYIASCEEVVALLQGGTR